MQYRAIRKGTSPAKILALTEGAMDISWLLQSFRGRRVSDLLEIRIGSERKHMPKSDRVKWSAADWGWETSIEMSEATYGALVWGAYWLTENQAHLGQISTERATYSFLEAVKMGLDEDFAEVVAEWDRVEAEARQAELRRKELEAEEIERAAAVYKASQEELEQRLAEGRAYHALEKVRQHWTLLPDPNRHDRNTLLNVESVQEGMQIYLSLLDDPRCVPHVPKDIHRRADQVKAALAARSGAVFEQQAKRHATQQEIERIREVTRKAQEEDRKAAAKVQAREAAIAEAAVKKDKLKTEWLQALRTSAELGRFVAKSDAYQGQSLISWYDDFRQSRTIRAYWDVRLYTDGKLHFVAMFTDSEGSNIGVASEYGQDYGEYLPTLKLMLARTDWIDCGPIQGDIAQNLSDGKFGPRVAEVVWCALLGLPRFSNLPMSRITVDYGKDDVYSPVKFVGYLTYQGKEYLAARAQIEFCEYAPSAPGWLWDAPEYQQAMEHAMSRNLQQYLPATPEELVPYRGAFARSPGGSIIFDGVLISRPPEGFVRGDADRYFAYMCAVLGINPGEVVTLTRYEGRVLEAACMHVNRTRNEGGIQDVVYPDYIRVGQARLTAARRAIPKEAHMS